MSSRALFIANPFNGVNGLPDPQAFANMATPYADVFWGMPVMNPVGGVILSPTPNDALALLGEFLARVTSPIWIWLSLNPIQNITVPLNYTPLSGPPSGGDVQLAQVLINDAITIMNWVTNIQTTTGYSVVSKIKGFCIPFDTSQAFGANLTQAQKIFESRNTMNTFISYARTNWGLPTAVDTPYPQDALTLTAPPSWRSNNPGGTQSPSLLGNNTNILDVLVMRNPLMEVVYNAYSGGNSLIFRPSRMQQFLAIQNAYVATYRNIKIITRQELTAPLYLANDNNGGLISNAYSGTVANLSLILDRAGFTEFAISVLDTNPMAYLAYSALQDTQQSIYNELLTGNIADLTSLNGIVEMVWLVEPLNSVPLYDAIATLDFDSLLIPITTAQQFSGQY